MGNQFCFLPVFPRQSPLMSLYVCDSVIHQSIPKQLPFRSLEKWFSTCGPQLLQDHLKPPGNTFSVVLGTVTPLLYPSPGMSSHIYVKFSELLALKAVSSPSGLLVRFAYDCHHLLTRSQWELDTHFVFIAQHRAKPTVGALWWLRTFLPTFVRVQILIPGPQCVALLGF